MATYTELFGLHNNSELRNKVVVACIVAAESIRNEADTTANHTNRLIWAAGVFANPMGEANRMYWALLAGNKDATIQQIQDASDAAIQAKVEAAVDLFATG